MRKPEQLELAAHREQIEADERHLIDHLAIAEWDVPEIDEPLAIRLVVTAIRQALDRVERVWPDVRQA